MRTSHLTVQAAASDTVVSPGSRFSLSIEVTPRRGMHVYAPGKHDYQVVRFVADSRPWLRSAPLTYPPSEIYHFVPLDERVETYLKPFTLVQDLTILATPEAQKLLAGQKTLTVSGTLEYQACDDKICYAPAKVPLSFALELAPLQASRAVTGRRRRDPASTLGQRANGVDVVVHGGAHHLVGVRPAVDPGDADDRLLAGR